MAFPISSLVRIHSLSQVDVSLNNPEGLAYLCNTDSQFHLISLSFSQEIGSDCIYTYQWGVGNIYSQEPNKKSTPPSNKSTCWKTSSQPYKLINSLDTREIPSNWKKAIVSPVFKKGNLSKIVKITVELSYYNEDIQKSSFFSYLSKFTILITSRKKFEFGYNEVFLLRYS